MHGCAIEHRRAYLHKLQRHRSRLEKQGAGKDNAGPSIGGTSTDFVSQNYLRIQNSIFKSCAIIYLYIWKLYKIIPLSTDD